MASSTGSARCRSQKSLGGSARRQTDRMTSFASASAVERAGDGSYTATIQPDFVLRSIDRAHGGYLLAILLRAALAEAPHAHPIATTAHFLRPGVAGPVTIELTPHPPG